MNRILIQFVSEEQRLGLREVPCIEIIEKVLLASNQGQVPKKDIIQIFKSIETINQSSIKNFLIQDFFFVDETRQKYDFIKIMLFNILYSGGQDSDKATFLFNALQKSSTTLIHNHEHKVINTIENLVHIPCLSVGDILNSLRRFQSETDDLEFQELLSLYSTNSNMIREFAIHLISTFLFPSQQEKQVLMRQEFMSKMQESNYVLVKPNELRKRYTEYVLSNKSRALLPSRQLRRTTYKESEESKSNPGSVRQTLNGVMRGTLKSNGKSASKKKKQQAVRSSDRNFEELYQRNNEEDALNKSISDKSMILYRYEGHSARPTNLAATQRDHSDNNRISINKSIQDDVSPIQSPNHKYGSRMNETDIQRQLQNITIKQQLNQSRESELTQQSYATSSKNQFNYLDMRKYPNAQAYLSEMFGEQFVNFVTDMQGTFDNQRKTKIDRNVKKILSSKVLEFPDYNAFPYHVRQIFEYYKALITREDILAFSQGTLFKENIVNVYFKILEKVNLVLQNQFNFQRATSRQTLDQNSNFKQVQPLKIHYFNTNFSKRLNNQAYLKDCINLLKDFFKYDTVVLPFFFDQPEDKRALIVVIRVPTSTVDLYDREREDDNHDISDTVLHMLDLASHIIEIDFSEDQIDGGVEGICVSRDEDMLVAMCHIAECVTFNKPIELDIFNCQLERQRILDNLTSLLNFQ